MSRLCCLFLLILLGPGNRAHAEIILPRILGDHMVLQSNRRVPIWGMAAPGEAVAVMADWRSQPLRTAANRQGCWRVQLPTPAPGGPHTLIIQGRNQIVLRDVLVGEVWICAGQSNMQMPVGDTGEEPYRGVEHWQEELKLADHPEIRLYNEPTACALTPQFQAHGEWCRCSAQSAAGFSAAGFFFGRELHQQLKVPIGLVCAAVGGTPAEAWTSRQALETMPDFARAMKALAAAAARSNELAAARALVLSNWARLIEAADGGSANASPLLDDSGWRLASDPSDWSDCLSNHAGFAWFRKTVLLPPAWADRDLQLEFDYVDDMDFTYVNGTKVGQTIGDDTSDTPRAYFVPAGRLNRGTNVIAVRVLNTGGDGGIGAPARLRARDSRESLSLDRDWRVKAGAGQTQLPPLEKPAFHFDQNSPSGLFNAMIAPLAPYAMRGVIWYQGEANIGRDGQYLRLFPALIADWRRHWEQGEFPFYFTQIAPFRYENEGQAGRAGALREAQRLCLSVPRTGMAVTMDSDSRNLHPADKQKVGHRLALWALAETYGRKGLLCSGPLYRKMRVEHGKAILLFDYVGRGLDAGGKPLEHFEIAGPDGNFLPAQAKLDAQGRTLQVWSELVRHPVAARYAWGDADESSFGNKEGLPAASFWAGQRSSLRFQP